MAKEKNVGEILQHSEAYITVAKITGEEAPSVELNGNQTDVRALFVVLLATMLRKGYSKEDLRNFIEIFEVLNEMEDEEGEPISAIPEIKEMNEEEIEKFEKSKKFSSFNRILKIAKWTIIIVLGIACVYMLLK